MTDFLSGTIDYGAIGEPLNPISAWDPYSSVAYAPQVQSGGAYGGGVNYANAPNTTSYAPQPATSTSVMTFGSPAPILPVTQNYAAPAPIDYSSQQAPAPAPVQLPQAPSQVSVAPTAPANFTPQQPLAPLPAPSAPGAAPSNAGLASNPYGTSGYIPPTSPLALGRVGAQLQGAPTPLVDGGNPTVSAGGGAPLSAPPITGPRGIGIGVSQPPLNPAPGPMSGHAPFAGLVAYNGNPAQGKGTANRGTLGAGPQTRGQELKQMPDPNFIPPPPPTEMSQLMAQNQPGMQQGQVDPAVPALMNPNAPIEAFVNEGMLNSAKRWDAVLDVIKKGLKELDASIERDQRKMMIEPRKRLDYFSTPNQAYGDVSPSDAAAKGLARGLDAGARAMEAIRSAHNIINGEHGDAFRRTAETRFNVLEQGSAPLRRKSNLIGAGLTAQHEIDARSYQAALHGQAIDENMKFANEASKDAAQAIVPALEVIKQRTEAEAAYLKAADQANDYEMKRRKDFFDYAEQKIKVANYLQESDKAHINFFMGVKGSETQLSNNERTMQAQEHANVTRDQLAHLAFLQEKGKLLGQHDQNFINAFAQIINGIKALGKGPGANSETYKGLLEQADRMQKAFTPAPDSGTTAPATTAQVGATP